MVWHNQAIPLPAQQANCLIGMANLGILNRYQLQIKEVYVEFVWMDMNIANSSDILS